MKTLLRRTLTKKINNLEIQLEIYSFESFAKVLK